MQSSRWDFDFVVIGSGFGGSVSAFRLTEKGYKVAIFEMGRRWTPENLPNSNWNVSNWIWRPQLGLHGFFNITPFRHVLIFHGCAVGGGSITYANTMLVPPDSIWKNGSWAGLSDWQSEMPEYFSTASRMLGVTENTILGPADHILRRTAESAGLGRSFYKTGVAVFQPMVGEEGGKTYPDPYFRGRGPERTTCIGCGGCLIGCRYNAKNSLDKNYLYLAEKNGAILFAESKVVDVICLNRRVDGEDGYVVHAKSSISRSSKESRQVSCRAVIFAASALGTIDLLLKLKEKGSLPALSDQVGKLVRTNAESLIGVRVPGSKEDLSRGIAIGSGVYIDDHTHIEVVRYPQGSDILSLLGTVLTDRHPGVSRILLWMHSLLLSLLRSPLKTIRALQPIGWARETMILLCMQTLDGHIEMRLDRRWLWPFSRTLVSRGRGIPAFIPQANQFARRVAELTGGIAMSMIPEVLFDIPGTAHILGGCIMADSPKRGVVDQRQRVFGYKNMYICDGSVLSANLGVNPSLTICALTERAMSYIPTASRAE